MSKSVENSQNSAQNSSKNVENSPENVEKSSTKITQPVENFSENVQNSSKNVDKTANSVHKHCLKIDKNVKSVKNSSKSVENSVKSVENAIESAAESPVKSSETDSSAVSNGAEEPIAIKVEDLHKSFRLPTERASGLKQAILNWFKGVKGYTEQKVLRGINFEVKKGEFLGIVGRNGSGKSTLLKLLAKIYYPEQGKVTINGTLVPFIELGVGFNPELTGRENVYLNGALLGFSRKEMDAMYDEIVRFAELEPFMDAKLKNYSSGMQVRLAFSIAVRAKGDILILDEVLAVGDADFQKKCNDYFASLHGNQTVILVTHSMENVRAFCDRAILIEKGEVAAEGDPETVATAYENLWKKEETTL